MENCGDLYKCFHEYKISGDTDEEKNLSVARFLLKSSKYSYRTQSLMKAIWEFWTMLMIA